jgi:hypothetical protein
VLTYVPAEIASSSELPTSMFPHTYSVYPFMYPRSLPWTMNTSGAFRIRRVGEWLGSSPGEELQRTGGLAAGNGHLLASVEYVNLCSPYQTQLTLWILEVRHKT